MVMVYVPVCTSKGARTVSVKIKFNPPGGGQAQANRQCGQGGWLSGGTPGNARAE